MKTSTIPACLALTLQLALGYGCGVSIDPGGGDSGDDPDASVVADSGIGDGGAHDAKPGGGDARVTDAAPGGDDARVVDAAPGPDASGDAGAESTPVQVEAGYGHTCALAANGTVRCWGANNHGQLGETTLTPYRTTPNEVAGLAGVSQIALGTAHTCALMSDTTVRCWGGNFLGQCGPGATNDFLVSPTAVEDLSGVLEIAAGDSHTCARLADGSLRCWGNNYSGQLGDGSMTNRPRPTPVPGLTGVAGIGLGANHSCVVNSSGNVLCWGLNSTGQVQPYGSQIEPYPVYVQLINGGRAAGVAPGFQHTCAGMADRTAQCWGANASGQLGSGGTDGANEHHAVLGLTTVVEIDSGDFHVCARLADGDVSCWGGNGNGQVGDGTVLESTTPKIVGSIADGTGITAASSHSCAVEAGGSVKCWGFNGSGELGDGTRTQRLVPAPVLW